jgi:hypothetical protein
MRRGISQDPDPVDPPRLLPLCDERRSEEHRTRASEERATVDHWMPVLDASVQLPAATVFKEERIEFIHGVGGRQMYKSAFLGVARPILGGQ